MKYLLKKVAANNLYLTDFNNSNINNNNTNNTNILTYKKNNLFGKTLFKNRLLDFYKTKIVNIYFTKDRDFKNILLKFIMNKSTLINLLKNASGVILGVGVHHFGGKILDRKENLAEYEAQVERDEISRELLENVKSVNNKFDNLTEIIEVKMNENIPIGADVATEIKNNIEK